MFRTPWVCGVIVCLALAVAAAGCASSLSTQDATPTTLPATTSPATVTTIVTTIPATTAASADDAARKTIDDAWKAIRIAWDDYVEDVDELGGAGASNQDMNHIREKIIPDAIGRYRTISANLSAVATAGTDISAEKTVLIAICGYKVRQLEGMESYYHAIQIETYDTKKAKDEYKNAKYTLQDALDAINAVNFYSLANSGKYSTFAYDDKGEIEDVIDEITDQIARL